jgi:adenylate cyclase
MNTYRSIIARLRLIAGLILLFYVFTHLLNHAVGIFGREAIEAGRRIFVGFWRSPLLYWAVPLSLIIHPALTLSRLFTRKTLRGLRADEWIQIASGLLVPPMLAAHYYATRIAATELGIRNSYTFIITTMYNELPSLFVLLIIVWIHGTIGLHRFLALKPWYGRVRRPLETTGLLLPILAMVGIIVVRREIGALIDDPAWRAAVLERANPRGLPLDEQVVNFSALVSAWFVGGLAAAFLMRAAVLAFLTRYNVVRVEYLGGPKVAVARGTTLLEASLQHGIPHAHECGGRGRCSTCRIQVIEGQTHLSRPGEAERRVLRRVGAGANVRLACQTVPTGPCVIHPLLPHTATGLEGLERTAIQQGTDKEIAILFADLRGFTALTEHKLPYDTVFILNQYFQGMGQAVEASGGYLDKFIGDGIMALFGLESDLAAGCRSALAAAQAMDHQLDLLNRRLAADIASPLQIGIGIHCGHVIVGEMGYRHARHLTAIGDAVNSASRLEEATKLHDCQLIVSQQVVAAAGVDFAAFPSAAIAIRGRTRSLTAYTVASAKDYRLETQVENAA